MKEVLAYLKCHCARFLEELCEFVAIPSVSAQPQHRADLKRASDWLVQHCRGIGLKVKRHPTPGNPVVTATTRKGRGGDRPHYLVYGHYDVQPADPFELWKTPPFEPVVVGDSLFGRGASDNKGQHFAHLKAVEAYLATGTPLPCDVTFLLEGEEEVGSEHLVPFLRSEREDLAVDGVVISDNGMPSLKHPALTYGLRGVVAFEVHLTGPNRDLHSGIYGGAVDNPAMVLSQLLGSLRRADGTIAVPGFYDGVEPLAKFERQQMARYPESDASLRRQLGVRELFGERGFSSVERRAARPTLEINGLTSGYQGEGSKTIVPGQASVKVTCRLVPHQKPKHVLRVIKQHLQAKCPKSVKMVFEPGHAGESYMTSPEGPQAGAALRALEQAFGRKPILMREGGAIPIVTEFKQILKVNTLLLGLGLPDDNVHSPNEKVSLTALQKGMAMGAYLWRELGAL
ncbi:MAG: Succinyl-diaminopimelate desuccinylase [Verrucomicrobia subdivision 3 bacterium]|nr:Succinyl-diaminopimelate desuccinylase [Limisphaerales bacterium]MCS1412361.1 Succinyl-diaminopimelate desuccinylase [Limisphaerales bacterium]